MNEPLQLKLNLVLPLDDSLDTFTAARVAKCTEKRNHASLVSGR